MRVPSFLLRRLYLKGSLRITATGFQFQLLNKLGSGYAKRLLPLTLDGEELDAASSTFEIEGKTISFESVASETPFTLAMNKTTTISYTGEAIEPGLHKIGMRFEVAGLGELGFDFTDTATTG